MSVRRARTLLALAAALLAAAPLDARAASARPGEVVVRRHGDASWHTVRTRDVAQTVRLLRTQRDVRYAAPNVVARAAAYDPGDPGRGGGWQNVQWNFAGPFGVRAPEAWQHLIDAGKPGGQGVVVAVLDTGVAYAKRGTYLASPDLNRTRFVRGYDFVSDDPYANDVNGHGTHVASTIAESTGNGRGLTGLAYGASIMPVRVLDDVGEGDATAIARGVRFAARRGADVINLSLEFTSDIEARDIPQLLDAISFATRRGALVVSASGNESGRAVAYPARSSAVLAVGATTERGCLSDFSNRGPGLDLVAPGGGPDAFLQDPNCKPELPPGRNIRQITLTGKGHRRFGIPESYQGTSMAVPHVSAVAALILASGVLGERPTPALVRQRLAQTARDLGPEGFDERYGAGLIDAAAATNRAIPLSPAPPRR